MRDVNSLIQDTITATATGASAWVFTQIGRPLEGTPTTGIVTQIDVTATVGNPNVLFRIQTSPDGVTPFEAATDQYGPMNYPGERVIRTNIVYPYMRLVWEFNANDPGYGSSNSSSSSLSGQPTSSSSSGGSSSITFNAGIVISMF